jgi:hypothetical protein
MVLRQMEISGAAGVAPGELALCARILWEHAKN